MSIASHLELVLGGYEAAASQPFAGHSMASELRHDLPSTLQAALGSASSSFLVKGSAGQGTWAAVPWVAVFDPLVTDTAQTGYYIVYLFNVAERLVHLSLNQGTTATKIEFGKAATAILEDRAGLMRRRLQQLAQRFPVTSITLGSGNQLPLGYEAGHALGATYRLGQMPSDGDLTSDLNAMVEAYRTLTFRGGLSPTVESEDNHAVSGPESLTEVRRYILHRKIERNAKAAAKAKKHHGYACQACGFDFESRYGEIGKEFIEAHHLRPLSSLMEGELANYNVANDFAVLCSNCHRMIHRKGAPADLASFAKLVVSAP